MNKTAPIVNRVAQSGIITLDLGAFYPEQATLIFDIKDFLFMGLILKEKDFRKALKEHDWTVYEQKNVAITCSADAIVPIWAYMLLSSYLEPYAHKIIFGDEQTLLALIYQEAFAQIDVEQYRDKRVVIKGCGDKAVPNAAYVGITHLLKPVVKSLMYGEPCSTVPIYKQKRIKK